MSRLRPAFRSIGPSVLVVLVGLAGAALSSDAGESPARVPAQAQDAKGDPPREQVATGTTKWAMPGPAHDKLKPWVGRWGAVVKSWRGSGEPSVSEGIADMQLILDGRFLEERLKGQVEGRPFRGFGLTGYDNRKAEYDSLWIDNLSTAMTTGSGAMDESGKVLTMKSIAAGPDGSPMEMKTVTKMVDQNTLVFSLYGVTSGNETRMMEITYTRL